MNQTKLNRQASVGERRLLRQQVYLVAVFAALALVASVLPLHSVHIPFLHYLPIHTLLEFASILAAFLVFATVWHTPNKEVLASSLLVAVALFSAGWLDFAHTLSFKGMPDLITSSSAEKGIAFWLVARLVVAATLLGVSFYPQLRAPSARRRYGILAAFTIFNLVVMWGGIFHEADLPKTFTENGGTSPFKTGFELTIVGLLVLAAWRYYRLARRSDSQVFSWLFGAASVAALGECFFIEYDVVNDASNLLGHLYKFMSYSLIYQVMFVVSVRKPYQELATQSQMLVKINEKLVIRSLALASTATPVFMANLQGQIHWRNRASYAMLAGSEWELKNGINLFSAPVTPDPIMAEDIRATVEAGRVWRGIVDLKDAQDNNITIDRVVTPLRSEEGSIEGYVSVAENVTERIRVLLRYKRVLDMATDGFWITDAQGLLLEVNDAYARMSGYTVKELLTMHISQLEAAEDEEGIREHLKNIMRRGHDQFETRHLHKEGHEFIVDISATYDLESKHFFVFSRDRSERVQAAAAKKDLERQLQQSQKMQALGQLTSGIAHDFNNILAAISGYSHLALDRFAPDKQGKLAIYLHEVVIASDRARDLIAKMLTFARTQPNSSADVISAAAVIEGVVAMMRPSISSSIQIKSHIVDDLPICIDAGELNQMLLNLIINARDAIDGQGIIEIHLHRVQINDQVCAASLQRLSGTYLALEVSDSGSGIALEYRPRLFDPFFTTKEVGKGTGLGLSMVQGILQRSGGHVVVESRLGQGSRFQLLFPLALPAEASPAVQQSNWENQSGTGQHIWVLDDEPAVACYFGELLEGYGYKVRLFNEASKVLTAFEIEQNDVDLLITDQTMPGLSGVELAQHLHSLRPTLPIILCTGHSDGIDRAKTLRHGIRRYFTKPVAAPELLLALAEIFEKKLF